ncbi:MAG TPA: PaaX family transcriptional regulator C-terminal domain-containing protein [Streptosporangiaceae bacterium]|nr:PaaX family transcriptional regulator C-terminal domain-containing protein [Streptosporangiaceae bacterium]
MPMTDVRARPTVSRRREIGGTSARSLLMTMLGEFVLPRGGSVWTQALTSALGLFGVEDKSARQALARTAAEGWLASQRVGRQVRWSLTPPGQRLLTEGARRIYSFGRDDVEWDGRWLVLLVSVPESQRDLRHRIRTQLNWAGFGSPGAGVWVSPHVGRQAEGQRILTEAGMDGTALSFVADYGQIGSPDVLVARSWDLGALEHGYEDFIDEFTGLDPVTDQDTLRAQTRLVHQWRRFPFLDPRLPAPLLPEDWSGALAASLFHTRHAGWHPAAQRCWARLTA